MRYLARGFKTWYMSLTFEIMDVVTSLQCHLESLGEFRGDIDSSATAVERAIEERDIER